MTDLRSRGMRSPIMAIHSMIVRDLDTLMIVGMASVYALIGSETSSMILLDATPAVEGDIHSTVPAHTPMMSLIQDSTTGDLVPVTVSRLFMAPTLVVQTRTYFVTRQPTKTLDAIPVIGTEIDVESGWVALGFDLRLMTTHSPSIKDEERSGIWESVVVEVDLIQQRRHERILVSGAWSVCLLIDLMMLASRHSHSDLPGIETSSMLFVRMTEMIGVGNTDERKHLD